ncbi:MAG TPA: aminoglycoside phosphotransferase family protein [Pyrinomonadaceae bacterium]|jgi:hygromycin-B 7''-O-kinase
MMRLNLPLKDAGDYTRHFSSRVWEQAASVICDRYNLTYTLLRRSGQGENIVFFVDERFVIKIFAPFREGYRREKASLEAASGKLHVETPLILYAGELEGWSYLVMTQLVGIPAREAWPGINLRGRMEIATHLGLALRSLHNHAAALSQSPLNPNWREFIERQAGMCVERQRACGANPEWLESLPDYLDARLEMLPAEYEPVLLHGDAHLGNLLLAQNDGRWRITGLFDFADSLCGFHEYDFVAPGVLMVQGSRELQRAMLLAYGYDESQLDVSLRARLMLLTVLYECSDLRKYALRLMPEAVNFTLKELEAAIWRFAE